MWNAIIKLRSNDKIAIDDLQLITDDKNKEIKDFKTFKLYGDILISFVGSSQIITLNSSEIEYLVFNETNPK